VACASNLRQIGAALHMYIDEHDFTFPPEISYWASLSPYLNDSNVWNCPSYNQSAFDYVHMSYAYNVEGLNNYTNFGAVYGGKDINEIISPSQCIALADSGNYPSGQDVWAFELLAPSEQQIGSRHSGGANVLFVDGHVGWHRQDVIINADRLTWWNERVYGE
ncbi:MAG: hypothetical protein Q8R48_02555, partial [Candidatus Omnitrophota bacterium]|nr:hypothetical protein [Candidatus Omnitrophota bacterium]